MRRGRRRGVTKRWVGVTLRHFLDQESWCKSSRVNAPVPLCIALHDADADADDDDNICRPYIVGGLEGIFSSLLGYQDIFLY